MKKYLLLLLVWGISLQTIIAQSPDSLKVRTDNKVGFIGIPSLSFNRSRGVGVGGSGMMMVHLDKHHPEAPASQFAITGQYTTKNDWMLFAFTRLFLSNDNYRLNFGGGYFNSNFQTYEKIGDESIEIPYNSHGGIIFLSPSIRIYDRFYAGISGQFYRSHLSFENPDYSNVNTDSYQNAIGANLMYDSKNSQTYPTKGLLAGLFYKIFPSWLSNDSTFNKINLFANYYYSLNSTMVLASRLSINAALGSEVPFVAQSYVGNKDIRGYTKGAYRGDQTYALQSELRWTFYKKWGVVGFFGLAMAHSPSETSPLLPGGGVGLRYQMLSKFKMNIGIDAAVGKDDWGIYFRIGEAF